MSGHEGRKREGVPPPPKQNASKTRESKPTDAFKVTRHNHQMDRLQSRVAELELALSERDATIQKMKDRFRSLGVSDDVEDAPLEVGLESETENELLLPLEIIGIVGSYLKPGSPSLSRLASTSSSVLHILAPSLYGTVSKHTIRDHKLPKWFPGLDPGDRTRWITRIEFIGSFRVAHSDSLLKMCSQNIKECVVEGEHEVRLMAPYPWPNLRDLVVRDWPDEEEDDPDSDSEPAVPEVFSFPKLVTLSFSGETSAKLWTAF
jgi:hypothetical protein